MNTIAAIGDDNAQEDKLTPETKFKCQSQKHSRLDLSRTDMLQLLSHLETELQAQDAVITSLKAEKAKHFLYQAKYGRFGLTDPLYALQTDSEPGKEATTMKAIYDDPLTQLDKLTSTQRKIQQQMKDQLNVIDHRYKKVCVDLEEERRKHDHDLEQGDSVVVMLENDRDRLRVEVDLEKKQNKQIELELEQLSNQLAKCARHKEVVLMLIEKRSRILRDIAETRTNTASLEERLTREEADAKAARDRLSEESSRSRRLETAADRELGMADVERDQLLARFSLVERRNGELYVELERLRSAVGTRSKRDVAPTSVNGVLAMSLCDVGAVSRVRHVHTVTGVVNGSSSSSVMGNVRYPPSTFIVSHAITGATTHLARGAAANPAEVARFSSVGHAFIVDKPTTSSSGVGVVLPSTANPSPRRPKTDVFSPMEHPPPHGTRISVGVSGSSGVQAPRKPAPTSVAGRGALPPIPPIKPEATVTQSRLQSASNPIICAVAAAQPSRSSQSQLKFGIAFSQSDRSPVFVDKPSSVVVSIASSSRLAAAPSSQTNTNRMALVVGETTAVHKRPSQVCVNIK